MYELTSVLAAAWRWLNCYVVGGNCGRQKGGASNASDNGA